jgi:hypothetical protein
MFGQVQSSDFFAHGLQVPLPSLVHLVFAAAHGSHA